MKVHDWLPDQRSLGRLGFFGYNTNASPANLEYGRIIQLGWTAGCDSVTDICQTKTATVKPCGWEISEDASKYGVSQTTAEHDGRPLRDVLQEFCTDLHHALSCYGARVVAHHLEQKATFVLKELRRVGLTSECDAWARIAQAGYCIMDPELSEWLCPHNAEGRGSKSGMTLPAIAAAIWPDREDNKPNTGRPRIGDANLAGLNAAAVRQIYQAVLARASGANAAKISRGDADALLPLPKTIHSKLTRPQRIIGIDLESHGWPLGQVRPLSASLAGTCLQKTASWTLPALSSWVG